MDTQLLLLSVVGGILHVGESLECYYCTSPLSPRVPVGGQLALKELLYDKYNVPPVNEVCAVSEDIDFASIDTQTCDEFCVKITVSNGGTNLVVRGCRSSLFREGFGVSEDIGCGDFSPSLCSCSSTLCNDNSPVLKGCFTLLFTLCATLLVARLELR